jgi:hypothetical protein
MLTLVNRTYAETCNLLIPQCRVDLGELRNDAVFQKRLGDELLGARAQASLPVVEKDRGSSAAKLVQDYLEREGITLVEFAKKARVDPTVVRALRRGKRKCSLEPLQRIASLLRCDVEDLLPNSGGTAKAGGKTTLS